MREVKEPIQGLHVAQARSSGSIRLSHARKYPSHTTFVVDPDINLHSAGLKELLSDEPVCTENPLCSGDWCCSLQKTGMKSIGKAEITPKKYDQVVAATRKWFAASLGDKKAEGKGKKKAKSTEAEADSDSDSDDDADDFEDGPEGPDPIAPDVGESEDSEGSKDEESFKFDTPEFKLALDDIPNEHSPKVLALYLVYKIFHQGKKIGTADTAREAWKRDGDTFRGKWHYNEAASRWEGSPVDSAEVEDTMESIKNKCGKDDGERKHSLTMTKEFMEKVFGWSDKVCPLQLRHSIQNHGGAGLEDEASRIQGFLIDSMDGVVEPDLPACDSYHWLPKWRQYLQDEVYQGPLLPDDYIFPAIGANGIVQTGEHLSHDDINKWIKEFANGVKLPQQNGTFSTHCFRRGGAQYGFMFAAVGRHWTLRQVRWWGAGLKANIGSLLPIQPEASKSFLGEASRTAPATTEQLSLLHQSISSEMRAMSGAMSSLVNGFASIRSGPIFVCGTPQAQHPVHQQYLVNQLPMPTVSPSTRALVPIPLSAISPINRPVMGIPNHSTMQPVTSAGGRPIPTVGLIVPDIPVTLPDGSRSLSKDSWRIVVQHWLTGDPAHGLHKPLKDWPKAEDTGPNKGFQMKRRNRMIIATEFIAKHEASFRARKGRSKYQSVYLCSAYLPPSSLRRTEAVLPPPHGAERPYLDKSSPPQGNKHHILSPSSLAQLHAQWPSSNESCPEQDTPSRASEDYTMLTLGLVSIPLEARCALSLIARRCSSFVPQFGAQRPSSATMEPLSRLMQYLQDIAASDKWPMTYFKTSNKASFDFKAVQDLSGLESLNRVEVQDIYPRTVRCVDASLIGHSGKAQYPRVLRNSKLRETLERTKYPARYSFVL
ncbi:hypothetical protein DFH09DRAFT_1409284 [Mycena vulgaris]|nr:hypothetical protein DFH09DRAFT_1409284 [Mycena vulgaris]